MVLVKQVWQIIIYTYIVHYFTVSTYSVHNIVKYVYNVYTVLTRAVPREGCMDETLQVLPTALDTEKREGERERERERESETKCKAPYTHSVNMAVLELCVQHAAYSVVDNTHTVVNTAVDTAV